MTFLLHVRSNYSTKCEDEVSDSRKEYINGIARKPNRVATYHHPNTAPAITAKNLAASITTFRNGKCSNKSASSTNDSTYGSIQTAWLPSKHCSHCLLSLEQKKASQQATFFRKLAMHDERNVIRVATTCKLSARNIKVHLCLSVSIRRVQKVLAETSYLN